MDEPTASLTQAETDHLLTVVRTLSASGVAVVFVSHRLAEVLDVSSRVTVLRDGRLVGVFDAAGMTQSRLTELMTGKRFDQAVTARDVGPAPIVVETSGLTRQGEYSDVNLSLRAGEIVGLIGLDRRRPHRTRPYSFRHDARQLWRDPPVRLSRRLHEQPRSDRRGHRLCLRGSSLPRPRAAAIDRRQHCDHDPEGDLGRRRSDLRREEIRGRSQARGRVHYQDRPTGRRRVYAVGRQSAARRAFEVARHVAEGP